MSTGYIDSSLSLGSGTVEISLSELKGMKASAMSLIAEMKIHTSNTISQAMYVANRASGQYDISVSGQSRAVLTQCDNLSACYNAVIKELEELASGIDKVITGFLAWEQSLTPGA